MKRQPSMGRLFRRQNKMHGTDCPWCFVGPFYWKSYFAEHVMDCRRSRAYRAEPAGDHRRPRNEIIVIDL